MIITRLWQMQPGKFFCISTKDRPSNDYPSGEWRDEFFRKTQFKMVDKYIDENRHKDIYFCPHGFTKPRRLKRYAESPKLLWADLDEVDPRIINGLLRPTVAWQSSPGRFCGIWITDGYITEDLNMRLTYHLGADRGGWDYTQVLRVPGTINYKYDSTPRVRLLWQDGPQTEIDKLDKLLPTKKRASVKGSTAADIFKKYSKKLPPHIRREVLGGRPKQGKRSEVLWKITNSLIEAGADEDEIFEIIRASPWNKFKGRRDADQQLRREINKGFNQHFDTPESAAISPHEDEDEDEGDDDNYKWLSAPLSEVEEKDIDWVYYPYFAKGEITIVEGDPGIGKSWLVQVICASITDGGTLPTENSDIPVDHGPIVYFDIENSADSVTKKRLSDQGFTDLSQFYQEERVFMIDDDITVDQIYGALERVRPIAVVFDTLNTYIGKADTHKSSESTQAMNLFKDLARRFDCAAVVLRHLTKVSTTRAIYRGQGSQAFAGVARVIMTVGVSPDDPDTRVVAVTKSNLSRIPRALTFTIEEIQGKRDRSRLIWGGFADLTSDDILSVDNSKHKEARAEKTQIIEYVKELLQRNPMTPEEIKQSCDVRGYNGARLPKLRHEIGARIIRLKKDGRTRLMWELR